MRLFFLFSSFLISIQSQATQITGPLPQLKIDPTRVSVSGVSSGAYFAVQFHLAHSDLVQGVGAVAGGTYWCAEGDSNRAQSACMGQPQKVSSQRSIEKAKEQADKGLIDPLANLENDRIYIFAASNDFIIKPEHSQILQEFYQTFVPGELITRATHPTASHGFLTKDFGNACGIMGTPWLQKCNTDLASDILDHLDPIWTKQPPKPVDPTESSLIFFDQGVYTTGANQMYSWGAAYVPAICRQQKCGLHVAFHGCQMNPDFIEETFVRNAGFLEAADRHGIVVLFPQSSKGPGNPYGCWDWYGLHGQDYINQRGAQIRAV
ncbi:MAG: PHB depolymerase family esterase, partial [Bdellovibrionales bacterium]